MQGWLHYDAVAATKWTTSLTSKEMVSLLRYSIQTVVYLGTKMLGGSHESPEFSKSLPMDFIKPPPRRSGYGLS